MSALLSRQVRRALRSDSGVLEALGVLGKSSLYGVVDASRLVWD
jgi:hypothetical protein